MNILTNLAVDRTYNDECSSSTTSYISDLRTNESDTDLSDISSPDSQHGDVPSEFDGDDLEAIAVCGLSLKFPQDATTADSLWRMMCEKRCAMTEFPLNRLNVEGFYNGKNSPNTLPNRGAHFISEDLGVFDAEFFGISPTEAAAMDPQQRWLLETAYRALENAGIPMEQISGSATSVFTGSFGMDYMIQLCRDAEQPPTYAASGFGLSMLANRLSWFFNLHGPSIGVDSACSSSAMALDIACQSLRSRSCDASLVCGSNLTFAPEAYTWMSNINFLSPDSRCHSFDHRANGYARGEGVVVLVLKRLTDAVRDGNTIRAVIRSTGSNEDGKTPGITQPSRTAQEQLIKETYQKAGLSMAYTRYFEAHGTGTPIGDPREAQAIGSAFQKYRSVDDPILVGAIKSNIGHLEGASGLAGVIKAILVLERAIIPPNTNFERVNPKIDTHYLRIKFPQMCEPWPTQGLRRASVSSFGFGGANSHVIIDDAYNYLRLRNMRGKHCTTHTPPRRGQMPDPTFNYNDTRLSSHFPTQIPKLLVLSAADQKGMDRLGSAYKQHFDSLPEQILTSSEYLDNLSYTLGCRRSRLSWRSFAITNCLRKPFNIECALTRPARPCSTKLRTAFVFTGQGAQWSGMGKDLVCYKTFQASLEHADNFLRSIGCNWSPTEELLRPSVMSRIDDPEYSQTLCTILQVALVDLLKEVHIQPVAVVGHSSGEIAAAYCAGHISRESAWKLAFFRGVLSSRLAQSKSSEPQGAMIAVGLSREDLEPLISSINSESETYGLTMACINSPRNVTVSGEERLIDRLQQHLDASQVFARKLRVPLAYHSPQMQAISDDYIQKIASIEGGDSSNIIIPMISSVTGLPINGEELLRPEYWARNMICPVQFTGAILKLCSATETSLTKKIDRSHRSAIVVNNLIEVGPHAALQGPLREILQNLPHGSTISYASAIRRKETSTYTFLKLVGEYWCMGSDVNLNAANETESSFGVSPSLLVSLPEYPFDHSHQYWFESRLSKNYRLRQQAPHELLGVRSNDWTPSDARWRSFLNISDLSWIEQHRVNGAVVFPAAGMLVMVLEAAHELSRHSKRLRGYYLNDIVFEKAIDFSTNSGRLETQVCMTLLDQDLSKSCAFNFSISSGTHEDWSRNCYGRLELDIDDEDEWIQAEREEELCATGTDLQAVISRCTQPIESGHIYDFLETSGLHFGPLFRTSRQQRISDTYNVAAEVSLIPDHGAEKPMTQVHVIHPVSLDAMLHTCLTAFSEGGKVAMATSVPSRISRMWISKDGLNGSRPSTSITTMSTVTSQSIRGFTASCGAINNSTNEVLLHLDNIELTNVTKRPLLPISLPISEQTYFHLDTKIALHALDNSQIESLLATEPIVCSDTQRFLQELSIVQEICLERLLSSVDMSKYEDAESWQHSYLRWAEYHLRNRHYLRLQDSYVARLNEMAQSFDKACEWLSNFNYKGRLFIEVAKSLPAILNGTTDPLKILFETELGKNFYEEVYGMHQGLQISKYLDLLAHQNPGLQILEIGAGTGSGTRHFLETLRMQPEDASSALRCKNYEFTDVSPAFFDKARRELGDSIAQMQFKVLDMEHDYTEQDFQENTYDVIIAMNALHVAANLVDALKHARKVLKVGGRLILSESFSPSSWQLGFVFGLLPGWWQGRNDGRHLSPLLSLEEWNDKLQQAGFSGNDIVLHDSSDGGHDPGIIVSTAVENQNSARTAPKESPSIRVILGQELNSCNSDLHQLDLEIYQHLGKAPQFSTLEDACDIDDLSSEYVILKADTGQGFLESLDESLLQSLQKLIAKVKHVLWVSRKPLDDIASPDYGLVDGLSRVLRSENYDLHLVTLLLEPSCDSSLGANHVVKILQEMVALKAHQNYEQEYIEVDGVLHTRRMIEANSLKACVDGRIVSHQETESNISDVTSFELKTHESGRLSAMFYIHQPRRRLSSKELEISVKSISVDTNDLAVATGQSSDHAVGRFCAGVISGAGADTNFVPGDRVVCLDIGCFRSHHQTTENRVIKLPDMVSFKEACAQGLTLATAHYSLVKSAKISKQDIVLIHHGATPVGHASIQLCKRLGVREFFVTASTKDERDQILDESDIPSNIILPHASFNRRIRNVSSKGAVDVEISGDDVPSKIQSMDYFRPFARSVKIQFGSHSATFGRLGSMSNVTTITLDINAIQQHCPDTLRDSFRYAVDHMNSVHSKAQVSESLTFSASQVVEAFESLRTASAGSSAVIDFEENTKITVKTPTLHSFMLDGYATYIIIGGLGGIGREIARWLVQRGAKHLVLLSRSGPRTSEAYELIKELQAQDVQVETPAADVADLASLQNVLEKCNETMPPIKGCIHAGMILKDVVFPNMKFHEWKATVDVKAKGAWNLHRLLPSGLDFFIMMSSMQGIIGRISSASYAAGNTYLDALARHRIAKGERAASICLGAVSDAGYLTEHAHLLDQLETLKAYVPMSWRELSALLDVYCDPNTTLTRSSIACQPIMGMKTPARALADGAELPFTMYQPLWQHMHHIPTQTNTNHQSDLNSITAKSESILSALASVDSVPEATDIITTAVGQRIASILGVPEDRLDDHKPMHSYGIDSLTAIDMRNWMAKSFDVDVAVFDILGGATTAGVAENIARKVIAGRTPVEAEKKKD